MSQYLVTYEVAESKISSEFHSFHTTFVKFDGELPTKEDIENFLDEVERETLLPICDVSIICMQKLAD